MRTMVETEKFRHYGLVAFLRRWGCTPAQFNLLCFLIAHPQAHLCADSLAGTLAVSRTSLLKEIAPLVKLGMVMEESSGEVTTYVLTTDPAIREFIGGLSELDACEVLGVRKELFDEG